MLQGHVVSMTPVHSRRRSLTMTMPNSEIDGYKRYVKYQSLKRNINPIVAYNKQTLELYNRMAGYNSDDFYDEQDDDLNSLNGFNEDDLNDEDYNLLYDTLDDVKDHISALKVSNGKDLYIYEHILKQPDSDQIIKDHIFENNFDLFKTLEELKLDYETDAVPVPSLNNIKSSKLSALIKSREKNLPSFSVSTLEKKIGEGSTPRSKLSNLIQSKKTESSRPEKLSKLSLLAKQRSQAISDTCPPTTGTNKLMDLVGKRSNDFDVPATSKLLSKLSKNEITQQARNSIPKKRVMEDEAENKSSSKKSEARGSHKENNLPFVIQDIKLSTEFKYLSPKSTNVLTCIYAFEQKVQSPNSSIPKHNDYKNSFQNILNTNYLDLKSANQERIKLLKQSETNFSKNSPDEKSKKIDEALSSDVSNIQLNTEQPVAGTKLVKTKPKHKINIDDELSVKAQKPTLSVVVFGNVDSGKSTLIGRLLYDLKIVDSKTLHKLTQESEKIGKGSFSLAWIMDQTTEERSRGITVDICQTQITTETSNFILIDSPGHKDYIPQMINGVSQADVAVLIIDSNDFEKSFNSKSGHVREQIMICKSLGIDRLVIAINKLDLFHWSSERFEEIKQNLNAFLIDEIKFLEENLVYIPTSGYLGGNIVKRPESDELDWYKGKTLIDILEDENKATNFNFEKIKESRFLLSITDVIESNNSSTDLQITGRVLSGLIQPGESIIISPSNETAIVDSIKINKSLVGESKTEVVDDVKLAIMGELASIKLRKVEHTINIKVGDIATKIDVTSASVDLSKLDKIMKSCEQFKCDLTLFDNMARPLLIGTPFILFRNNLSIPARISGIEYVEAAGSKKKKKKAMHLGASSKSRCIIEVLEYRQLPLLTYEESAKLGRVVIRKDGESIGAGLVVELL